MRSIHTKIKSEFEPLLNELALHALLHLLSAHSVKLLSHKSYAEKNDILSAWLNRAVSSKKYKPLKKKIRTLVSQARASRLDIELLLNELAVCNEGDELPNLDSFLLLINILEKELNTTVLVSSPEKVNLEHNSNSCLLCVLASDLNAHFNSRNELVKSVSMLFRGTNGEKHALLRAIYASSIFDYTVEFDDSNFLRFTLKLQN